MHPVRLLLIDGDEDDYNNLRGLLADISAVHYTVTWRRTYDEGLTELLSQPFDACLAEYHLGEKTGIDLLAEAQAKGSDCPIILLTEYGDVHLDIKAMESGAADYLVKGQITSPLLERAIRYSMKHGFDVRRLNEQKENFKTLFNSTFEGILVCREGVIVDANSAAENIFGYKNGELTAKRLTDLTRAEDRPQLTRQIETGRDLNLEIKGLRSDDKEIWLALSSRTLNLGGHWVSLIAVQDLTQRKLMESQILQQDRLASLGLLASSLAHEIGTPLGVIRGRAEMLAKSQDEKTKATMNLIVTQIDRIAKLVHSLLHLARGQSASATTDVSVKAVLSDVTALIIPQLQRKSVDFALDIPDDLLVRAEPGPLGQVFLNLIVNALHAVESTGANHERCIAIAARADGETVAIAVKDTGCGIPEANLSRLFQPFFTTKGIGLGTGLGLATSYKLVTSWGGGIRVESQEGLGSTFTVNLKNALPH